MTDKLKIMLRDWWRGFTDADRQSAIGKTYGPHQPGGIIPVTHAELRALITAGDDRSCRCGLTGAGRCPVCLSVAA